MGQRTMAIYLGTSVLATLITLEPTLYSSLEHSQVPSAKAQAYAAISRRLPLQALWMTSARTGWGLATIDGSPVLLTTSDGALTWSKTRLPPVARSWQWSFYALSATDSWVIARDQKTNIDRIYFTNDGGMQWARLSSVRDNQSFANLDFVSRSRGWLITNGFPATVQMIWHLYTTSDGGRRWQLVSNSSSGTPHAVPESAYANYSFTGPLTAWITGMNPVASTTDYGVTRDGGTYWRYHALPAPMKQKGYMATLFPPYFFSPSRGVMPVSYQVNAGGRTFTAIFETSDAGVHWRAAKSAAFLRTNQPIICDVSKTGTIYAVANSGRHEGILYVTRNSGRTWQKAGSSQTLFGVSSVWFVSPRKGFAYTDNPNRGSTVQGRSGGWEVNWSLNGTANLEGGIVQTNDGGRTWKTAMALVMG